jgi:amidophosphoribosyltransferase
MLRKAGAQELHMRVSAPAIRHPCYYGIDFPETHELIAARHSVAETRDFLGVDSLGYQTVEGLMGAVCGSEKEYCTACFTGRYPVPVHEDMHRLALERRT